MSFPASFSLQLTAVMEALLKAVVAEVTALVEDGAVELRLELRDRDREIREKQREIEQRDRDILKLRAAVEELRAREEAAGSPGEERPERTQSCQQEEKEEEEEEQLWTKEEDPELVVKSEPEEEFSADPDLHPCLWPPSPLPPSAPNTDAPATCAYDASSSSHDAQNYHAFYSEQAEDFPAAEHGDLSLDSLLNESPEQFHSQKPGFFPFQIAQNGACVRSVKRRFQNARRLNPGELRCDQCGKTFTAKKRLMSHQSVHTGAKPFSCRICGKMFSRQDNCVRHEKAHK